MKFFIDTANLAQIQEAQELGVLDGVTTNPSLMAKEGISGDANVKAHYKAICAIVDGDVSAEVIATDYEGMIKEGEELAALDEKIVVKIPMIKDGVKALKYFSDKGIKTNCTLIFSAGQALMAAKAGATYVSPFFCAVDLNHSPQRPGKHAAKQDNGCQIAVDQQMRHRPCFHCGQHRMAHFSAHPALGCRHCKQHNRQNHQQVVHMG